MLSEKKKPESTSGYSSPPRTEENGISEGMVYSAPPRASDWLHGDGDVDDSASLLSHSKALTSSKIPASDIEIEKKLGEGNCAFYFSYKSQVKWLFLIGSYGVVFRGEWAGTPVAIKQIKSTALAEGAATDTEAQEARAEFERELEFMAEMRNHRNVVAFYGVSVSAAGDLALVLEFCSHGALENALYGSEDELIAFSAKQKLSIAHDSACGLAHIHTQNLIHRDIAARNILLHTSELTAKVADLGMARKLNQQAYQQMTRTRVGPLKWMVITFLFTFFTLSCLI